jgi:hypothetical protein
MSRCEEVHGRLKPVVVVVVGPDDLKLKDDQAVLVDAGWFSTTILPSPT